MHTAKRSIALGLGFPLMAATLIAGPARADNRNDHHQHDDRHWHDEHHHDRRGYYGQPPIVYYGQQQSYYAPPPVVYYGQPSGLSLNFNIP